jgi:hypothetical protein
MSAYLTRLVERTLGSSDFVEPRLRASVEPSPQTTTAREFTNEGSDREIGSETNTSAERRRLEPAASDAETSKVPVEIKSDLEATLVPLTIGAPETPALHKGPRRSAEHSSRPARGISTAAHRESAKHELREDEGAEMRLTPNFHPTPPRTFSIAPVSVERTHARRNGNFQAGELPPAVKVSIGRVEVRALFSSPVSAPPQSAKRPPTLSLEDYLKSRNGGER